MGRECCKPFSCAVDNVVNMTCPHRKTVSELPLHMLYLSTVFVGPNELPVFIVHVRNFIKVKMFDDKTLTSVSFCGLLLGLFTVRYILGDKYLNLALIDMSVKGTAL